MFDASLSSAVSVSAYSLSLEDDADRLVSALHVDDIALGGAATVLRVIDQDGSVWVRTLISGEDRASWCRVG